MHSRGGPEAEQIPRAFAPFTTCMPSFVRDATTCEFSARPERAHTGVCQAMQLDE